MNWFEETKKNMLAFALIPGHSDDAGSRNPSLWKTKTCTSPLANTMAADVLGMQGARASTAMVLIQFFLSSAPEGLILLL